MQARARGVIAEAQHAAQMAEVEAAHILEWMKISSRQLPALRPMTDRYNLQRFVDAQVAFYQQVLAELRAGRKRSHWMWFIFPQIAGLGLSEMARRYAISSLDEAKAYLAHPVLGARLRECTALVNETQGSSIDDIFGEPDNLKLHSSTTLFACASGDGSVFELALRKYFGGKLDSLTDGRLQAGFHSAVSASQGPKRQ